MATQMFLRDEPADTHRATDTAPLVGGSVGWSPKALATTRGSGLITANRSTSAGPTAGLEWTTSPRYEWLTLPVAADVTISGVITANLWASENDMNANAAVNFVVDKVAATDQAITQIVKSARTTELAITTRAVNNFTATPGAGVALNRGDRLRVRIFIDDAGTMGGAFTCSLGYGLGSAGADGDSYITFNETVTFESSDPAGTQLFLTSTGAGINPGAANELEMWTSRGGGSANLVTNTATGWTAGIQVTDSGGGTAQEWYSKQLTAFTLGGKALVNVRVSESNAAANASLRAEIAVCDSDGSNPAVWGTACLAPITTDFGEPTTTDAARTVYIAGDDTAVAEGNRLRLRLYVDDASVVPLVTGHTVTVSHNGTSGGAAGDTYLTLPQSVTEFVTAVSLPFLVTAPYRPA